MLFPRVGERVLSWRRELEAADAQLSLAVVEVPLLFEAGMQKAFDTTVAVIADERLCETRAGARDHGEIDARAARQYSQAQKATRADYVVENSGTLADLRHSIAELAVRLTESFGEGQNA